MSDCIFCKIVAHQSPSQMLYQDEHVTAFRDIHPVAPVHVLIIPNQHIPSINDLTPDDETLVGHLFTIARQIAGQEGIARSGYRLIINNGPHAGQLIGGQPMRYPMG